MQYRLHVPSYLDTEEWHKQDGAALPCAAETKAVAAAQVRGLEVGAGFCRSGTYSGFGRGPQLNAASPQREAAAARRLPRVSACCY